MKKQGNNPGGTAPGLVLRAGTPAAAWIETSVEQVLENGVPLSRSLIWRRQREFYIGRGLEAWTGDRVPQFITNNPFIAEIYAVIVLAFLRDCREQDGTAASERRPLRVLELGAGTGKFAYLFLRHLSSLLEAQGIAPEAVQYTMTDCAEPVVESWKKNSYLQEFVSSGRLKFARYEAGQDLGVLESGDDSARGPLVVIANYVLDSLPQDAFSFHDGQIEELLLTTAAPGPAGADPEASRIPLQQLRIWFQPSSIARERYSDAVWNGMLEDYRKRLGKTTVLFPTAALEMLGKLEALSDGRVLLLAADKGHAHEDTLAGQQGPPAFEWHAPECFSLMANFDAIRRYFAASGGEALLPDKHSSSLHICGFLRGCGAERFARTEAAYREAQAGFGPDDLFAMLAWLNAHMGEIRIPQILATLRLSRWDPIALIRLFPVLGPQLRSAQAERHDLRQAALRSWANHYPVGPEENILAFDCGVILLELGFFAEAMEMFRNSQHTAGPSAATSYNLGLCAKGLGRTEDALAWMNEACALDPAFAPAQQSRDKLQAEAKSR